MAEPGKETAATPPPLPQEPVFQAPAAVEGPCLETDTPISASQHTETAAALDSALPKAESAHQPLPPPPQETGDVAAVGAPEQTTTEADGQPPVATMPQKGAALPPPSETPAQESAAPAALTLPPPPQQQQQKQEGGVPELASSVSVHEEEKDAPKAKEEGEKEPARRRWRRLRDAVCLLFLRPKSGETKPATQPSDKQPVSGLEEKPPAPGEKMPPPEKDSGTTAVRVPSKPKAGKGEGETEPAALDGKRPEPGKEKVATLPPPSETSSKETTAAAAAEVAAEAEKQLAAPAPQQPPLKQEGGAPEQAPSVQEEKDAARRRGGETKQPVLSSGLEDKKLTPGEMPLPADSAGKPAVEKVEGEMKPPAQGKKRPLKMLQMAGRLVHFVTYLYNKIRSQSQEEKPAAKASGAGGEEGSEAKASSELEKRQQAVSGVSEQKEQHPNWPREEMRLEDILEEAFTRLLAAEYIKELSGVRQKCLLTFSVFELDSEVKKQAMIYWWVAEFNLRHRSDPARAPAAAAATGGGRNGSPAAAPQGKAGAADAGSGDDAAAEDVFSMLSDHGFLVPVKNCCSKVIRHGRQVNPLVHWLLKRHARGDRFTELDDKGSPADLQTNSSILCLTAGNRRVLQRMRVEDQSQPQAQDRKKDEARQPKVTKEPSLQGKGDNVQDQQQPTTKDDEAQVGSKSMAAPDKEPSKKDDDATEAKDQQTKDQQQSTTKDMAQVGSKSMSQKDEDLTQAKDQLTKGPQNFKFSSEPELDDQTLRKLFEGKRVILNVNAHVYPISRSAFLHLAECLVVLQLGRWNNLDDKTYMEVEGLMDSQNPIGLLKNLRYLGLRGLSRLTELPKGIESLKKLVILDMRGCQNLVKVEANDLIQHIKQKLHREKSVILTQLKQLTHLDLTECYMLEHIGRGITSLTELQVFKGFVFATGTHENNQCRIQDLKKLKKLQKLTVSITTDANVGKGEMAELKHLTSLQKLTITWSEIPSILEGETKKVADRRRELVERWTSFQLPKYLMKLDIRCYPKEKLELEWHTTLEKLYLRGGDMQRFSTKKSTSIKTLRLRYLKKFTMEWEHICSELQNIEYVEIVGDNKHVLKIPDFTLDGHGVWTKDQKEEDNKKFHGIYKDAPEIGSKEVQEDTIGKKKEPTKNSSAKDASAISSGNKDGDKDATKEQAAAKEE